ncbi:dipeptide/oligopeptide/nickel ABC transporter permease/ATP-binding protein [Paenibacillus urinalis]|uniref:Dipeptide/oligopeptide/nickel ABC transporter permease/ATP-binding protein n=1 Tax=Paenibacillus urinalis TaxID=521520 RepID=A0AAX3N402_9BACL|nr:dipeptide/oligopeptide/nickel ABC transporter permease/ATP-binding protein [Paenibacillus urinalis]WDH83430.1 dipeptide/oligopeptide/nickel ABC transporter permease/ATP-binding protein [Paenibacillus urinalis]
MKLTWSQKIGTVLFAVYVIIGIFGPLVIDISPHAIDGERLMPPSGEYWLGTNAIGQNLFSQLIYGARTTLIIGLTVALISTFLSAALGLMAGYSKRLDPFLNGLANMLLVLPSLLLILIVASFTGGGTWQLILTLSLLTWPGYMRLIRATVLSLKEREFVKAAQLYNGSSSYILRRHLLPFIWPLVRTKFIVSFQSAVAMEASLSFLGIGDPSTVSWGRMLQDAFSRTQTFLTDAWLWMVVPPAGALLIVIMALAMMGEGRPTRQGFAAKLNRPESRVIAAQAAKRGGEGQAAAISVQDLSVTYGDKTIVHPISFEVKEGSITSLVGESGSGKTTLARAVYGLVPDDSVTGSVQIGGHSIYAKDKVNTMQRWIDAAYIFQDPRSSFNPIMTIGQQFDETMKLQHSKEEKHSAAVAALKEVQLGEHVLSLYPHQLSGGMLARALIALAFVNKPKVLIADEPTGALDPLVKREVFDLLVTKVRENRMALLLITHDIPAAEHISDLIIVLHGGRAVEPQYEEQSSAGGE